MTSKRLFFNYMKQDLKKHLWLISLSILTQFFCIIVFPIMALQHINVNLDGVQKSQELMKCLLQSVSGTNVLLICTVVVGAVLSGLTVFSYLNAKDKVDFYHSLPIRRELIFIASYLNGFLLFAIPYILLVVLIVLIGTLGFGITGIGAVLPVIFKYMAVYLAAYWMLYSVAVLAVMLTGNIIIAFLGTAILMGYNMLINGLFIALQSLFFEHYVSNGEMWSYSVFNPILWVDQIFSPIMNINYENQVLVNLSSSMWTVIIWSVVLTLASLAIYCFRSSEATGCAMAFPYTKPVIKCCLLIPLTIYSGLFFKLVSEESYDSGVGLWMIFGLVMGCLIGHGLLQVILEFDFKAIIKGRCTLGICAFASFLIICIYSFDLIGYDSYLPSLDKIESAAIVPSSIITDYMFDDEGNYTMYMSNYMLENMKLTERADLENVLEIAQKGMEFDQYFDQYYEEDVESLIVDENGNSIIGYTDCTIKYQLKNGRTVYRSYRIPTSSEINGGTWLNGGDTSSENKVMIQTTEKNLEKLYNSEQYKEAAYPILTQDENVRDVYITDAIGNQFKLNLSDDEYVRLFRTYTNDLKSLTWETKVQKNLVGVIQFVTKEGDTNDTVPAYPIYSTFTQTLDLLEWSGYKLEEITLEKVESISVLNHAADADYVSEDDENYMFEEDEERVIGSEEGKTITYTDPAQIEEILKNLRVVIFVYNNVESNILRYEDNYEITINGKSDSGSSWAVNAYFLYNCVPDFVQNQFK